MLMLKNACTAYPRDCCGKPRRVRSPRRTCNPRKASQEVSPTAPPQIKCCRYSLGPSQNITVEQHHIFDRVVIYHVQPCIGSIAA